MLAIALLQAGKAAVNPCFKPCHGRAPLQSEPCPWIITGWQPDRHRIRRRLLSARREAEGGTEGREHADERLHYKLPDFLAFHGIFFKVKHVRAY